jgi:hypothetical protein
MKVTDHYYVSLSVLETVRLIHCPYISQDIMTISRVV